MTIVRRMTLDDLAQVVQIDQASFKLPWSERAYRYELTENTVSRCWVAEAEERVAAILVVWLILDEAHIATIATHPEFRRRGIGRALLMEALVSIREEGTHSAMLEVRASNESAQEMYKSFGFKAVGLRKNYYKDNNEDAILMTLECLGDLRVTEAG